MSAPSKDELDALRNAANRPKATPWIVTEKQSIGGQEISVQVSPDVGGELIGTVVSVGVGTSKFPDQRTGEMKRYPIVEVETPDGAVFVVFGHGVYLSDLFGVEVGDLVIIRFDGYGEAKGSKKAPKLWKVAALRDGEAVRLSNKAPESAAVGLNLAPASGNPFDVGEEPF